jgi:hypothetical protein
MTRQSRMNCIISALNTLIRGNCYKEASELAFLSQPVQTEYWKTSLIVYKDVERLPGIIEAFEITSAFQRYSYAKHFSKEMVKLDTEFSATGLYHWCSTKIHAATNPEIERKQMKMLLHNSLAHYMVMDDLLVSSIILATLHALQ